MIKKLIFVAALTLLALTLVGFFGQLYWVLDLSNHFRLLYVFASLFLLVFSLLFHPNAKITSGILALTIAINTLIMWPYLFPTSKNPLKASKADFSVLQMNLWDSNIECEKAIDYALTLNTDFIAHEEVSSNCRQLLLSEAYTSKYPYIIHAPQSRILLASKTPMESHVEFSSQGNKGIIVAHTLINNKSLTLLLTHPKPPHRSAEHTTAQLEHFEKLATIINPLKGSNIILIGDLNTTPFSYSYKRLTHSTGLNDTMRHFGLSPSYPANMRIKSNRLNFLYPFLPIDHVLYQGGIEPVSRKAGPRVGSDHLPVVSEFIFKDTAS